MFLAYSSIIKAPTTRLPTDKKKVWQAIGEDGIVSVPYFATGSVNSKVYLEECIKKVLVPFIDAHYERSKVLFWPDMARVHYTREVREYLDSIGIEMVSWLKNAPKVPQARPIDKFWALCKAKYAKKTVAPKNFTGFKQMWRNVSKKVADTSGKALIKNVRRTLRQIGCDVVYAPLRI